MKKQILAIGGACLMTALAVLPCGPPHEVVIPQTVVEIPQALPVEHDKSKVAIESITRYNPSITDGEAENLWRIVRDTVGRFRADPAYSGGAVEKITPELVLKIRADFPQVPIIATGGPTEESMRETIAAGADAITWTPPSNGEVFRDVMEAYRQNKAHP